MHTPRRVFASRLPWLAAAALALALQLGCASVDAPWPEQAVTLEQVRPTTPLRTQWLSKNSVDRSLPPVKVIVHAHVDAEGRTVRARLAHSGGNPQQDEAALHTLRQARFVPFRGADGVAVPVTLVAALFYPQEKGADSGLTINR